MGRLPRQMGANLRSTQWASSNLGIIFAFVVVILALVVVIVVVVVSVIVVIVFGVCRVAMENCSQGRNTLQVKSIYLSISLVRVCMSSRRFIARATL